MTLTLTTAALAALADGGNVGVAGLTLTTLAVGDGAPSGPAAARTALVSERARLPVVGVANAVQYRVAWRADLTPTGSYNITEVILFGRLGAAGAEFAVAAGGAVAAAAAGQVLVLAGVLDVGDAAADVTVTVSPTLVFGPGTLVSLSDTPAALTAGAYLRATSPAADAVESVDRDAVRADLNTGLAALVDAAAIAWDVNASPNALIVLGGNRTMSAPTGALVGGYYLLTVQQDGTGGRALAWNVVYGFTGVGFNAAPTLATAAHARTKFAFTYEANKMRCLGRVAGF